MGKDGCHKVNFIRLRAFRGGAGCVLAQQALPSPGAPCTREAQAPSVQQRPAAGSGAAVVLGGIGEPCASGEEALDGPQSLGTVPKATRCVWVHVAQRDGV